jgi:hypothetical protein
VTHPAANPEFLDVDELPARTRRIYQAVMGGSNLPLRTAGYFSASLPLILLVFAPAHLSSVAPPDCRWSSDQQRILNARSRLHGHRKDSFKVLSKSAFRKRLPAVRNSETVLPMIGVFNAGGGSRARTELSLQRILSRVIMAKSYLFYWLYSHQM